MKNFLEQPSTSSQEEQPVSEQKTGREKRAQAISRYIEKQVIGKNESLGEEEEREIEEYYKKLSLREKVDILYGKMMAYVIDKRDESARKKEADNKGETFEPTEPDPYLISDIKVLFKEPAVRALFSDTYGEARMDAKKFRLFELGNLWDNMRKEIQQKKEKYKMLERDLHLGIIKGQGKISSAKSRMARLAENISALEQRKKGLETLRSFPEIAENTDMVANFQYESLKEYKKQLEKGFVWLPSRLKIHQETVSAILNHRWPVLIGEAGTGKSDQADAAAIELTGYPPTEIECESTTGEAQLIEDVAIDPETGGSYKRYGALMQAFTGYDNSQQREPSFKTGRIARFDESGRLGPKAYAIIKKARQKRQG